jgi:hypothetical protein
MIFLADIRWGAFATILWWVFSLLHRKASWRKQILNLSGQTLLALLLSAPLILPLIEYSLLSTRSSLDPSEVLTYSLPAVKLLGIIFPGIGGFHEWVLYPGGIVFILALSAIVLRGERNKVKFWVGVFLASLFIALGSQMPGMKFLVQLPLVGLMRVPSRALFLVGMSLAALSGFGLEKISKIATNDSNKLLNLFLFALIAFSSVLAAGIYFIQGKLPIGILWGCLIIAIGVLWIGLRLKTSIPIIIWIMGVFFIGLIDLSFVNLNSFQGRSAEDVYSEREVVAQYLASQPGEFRTYSPSYSIPQHTAVRYGLELTDGVDPLQIEAYAQFMESATGVPRREYSVTIPSYKNGDPKVDNARYSPDAEKLGLLNVGYVVSDFELDNVDGLTLEQQFEQVYVYKNSYKMPRVWVEVLDESTDSRAKPAEILARSANSFSISAEGPGTVIASEINYPGWKVWVDGEEKDIEPWESLLRAVQIEEGMHEVAFSFQPESIKLGLVISITGIFLFVVLSISQNHKLKK